jgi:uncharacterized protein YabN with tetrapyrrole methylase and pyrophosphatase domain
MKEFKAFIKLVKQVHELDKKRKEPKYMDNRWLLGAISSELKEVQEEIKLNNIAHLEDELSDILWGWLTLIENLKDEGYVTSHEAIIKRGLKKYEERISPLYGDERDHKVWREVKERQKIALEKEKRCQTTTS